MVLDSSVRSASIAPARSPQAAGGSSVCRCRQIVSRAAGASPLPGRTLSGGLGRPFVARRISAISAVLALFVLACGALLSGPAAYGQSPEPTLNVAVANTPVAEGSVIEFVVSLSAASAATVTVDYGFHLYGATAGRDYTASPGTLTFEAPERQKTITVQTLQDDLLEENERVVITLADARGARIGTATATAVIQTDTSTPWLQIGDKWQCEKQAPFGFRLPVRRGGERTSEVTVDYTTVDGTAKAGQDYTAQSGTLTFPANGTTIRLVTVEYLDDAATEGNETFRLQLSNAQPAGTGFILGRSSAVATIMDNDGGYDCRFHDSGGGGDGAGTEGDGGDDGTPPGAPRDLSANPGNPRVTLSWAPGPDGGSPITGYDLRMSSDGGQTWSRWRPIAGGDADTVSHTVTGLTNGITYSFELRARNAHGPGVPATVSAIPATTPGAPRDLSANAGNPRVTLSWAPGPDGGSPITGYELRLSSDDSRIWSHWQPIPGSDARTTSHTVTGLTNGTTYSFQLRARNAQGAGAVASVDATPATTPGAPRGLSADTADGRVTLSWSTGPDGGSAITGYEVRRSSDGGWTWVGSWQPVAGSNARTVAHTVTDLANGAAYSFQVRARNAHGPGAATSVSAIPATTPGAPRDLAAAPGDRQVMLSWTPGPDGGSAITGYEIRRSSDDRRTWSWRPIAGSDARTVSHIVTDLVNGTTYSFELRARNAQGAGAVASVDATPATTPGAPRGLSADAADGLVTLSWSTGPDGGSPITGYEVGRSSDGGRTWFPAWQPVAGSAARTVSHTVTDLRNGTTYSFQMRARNARGPGAPAFVSATPATTPGAPLDLAAAPGDRQVTLSWSTGTDGGSPVTGYELRLSSNDGRNWSRWRPIAGSAARTVSHIVTGVRNGTTYSFELRARNARGAGAAASVSATPATNADAWLPRFGRAVAAQVVEAVGTRVLGQANGESQATLAGYPLARAHDGPPPWAAEADAAAVGVPDFGTLLVGSSFTLAAAGNERPGAVPHWTVWGRGAATQFAGEEQGVTVAGTVLSGTVGVDYEAGSFVGGLGVSYSDGSGGYTLRLDHDRDVTSWLLSAHPYLRLRLGRVSLWGLAGYGLGMLGLTDDDLETELSILMGALGASAELLLPAQASGFGLAARGDALIAVTTAAPADGLVTEDAEVTRLRLLLAGSYRGAALGGLAPALEVGVRHDGGAADEGLGLVLGGGLRYAYPPWGLELAANAQWLPLHEQAGFAQWGAGGTLAIAPGAPGHGPALSLNSSWGAVSSGAAQDLWTAPDPLATPATADPSGQFAAELRYGVPWRGSRTLVTPYAGLTQSARGDRIWRLGTRVQLEPSVNLTLEGSLNEPSAGIGQQPAVALRASLR